MVDSKIPSIESLPVPVTDQQLQPHTNHIVEDQPHSMAENVTLEEKMEEHTVGMAAVGIERRSDAQSEYIAVKGVKTVAQKQEVERIRKTETSEGQTIERWVETRYLFMIDIAIKEIEYTKYPHMIEGATPVYSPSPFEKCLDCCCAAYSCKWLLSPLKKRQNDIQEKQKEEKDLIPKTESIRRAQTLGVKNIVVSIHNIFTDTPVGSTVREVAVYGSFLWALLFFSISLWGFIKGQINENDLDDDFFGLFKTIFGAIGMVFSIFDLFYHVYHRRFETCKEWKQWREKRKNDRENTRLLGEVVDKKEKEDKKQPDPANCCKEKCDCFPKPCSTAFDVGRVFVNEMLYYPGLILSIFQFATELVINDNDPHMISVTTWLSNIISFIGQLVFVYLTRAFVLAGTVYSVAKIRNKKDLLEGAKFQITFVLYTYGLMMLQICMIVAIGATYYNDYNELYQEVNSFYAVPSSGSGSSGDNPTTTPTIIPTFTPVTDINYTLSNELWFMICCAFMTPILGVIMFFVVHHFWTQKFPIEVILDFLKVLKKRSLKGTLTSWKDEEINDKISRIIQYLNEEQLHEDVRRIPSGRLGDKFTYPFKSPLHIILCLLYAIMLLTFFVCCIVKGPGGGWLLFYFVAFAFGFLVNLYACSVAAVWIAVFVGVLIAIACILLIIILICCIGSQSSSNRNNNY